MNEKTLTQSQFLPTSGSLPKKLVVATPLEVSPLSLSEPFNKLAPIPVHKLAEMFEYKPDIGVLVWTRSPTKGKDCKGKRPGTVSQGYQVIQFRYQRKIVRFSEHRAIWAIITGAWPLQELDHINGDRRDNRIENLREVSSSDNKKNSKLRVDSSTGVAGVIWHKKANKWQASIRASGIFRYLGLFATIEEAIAARVKAEKELGFHPNHGRL